MPQNMTYHAHQAVAPAKTLREVLVMRQRQVFATVLPKMADVFHCSKFFTQIIVFMIARIASIGVQTTFRERV